MASRKLGKGLNSLLSNRQAEESAEPGGPLWVPVGQLKANRQQPRLELDRGLEELAESIRAHGILQPILVTPEEAGSYEILAGERRWRAARKAGLKSVPVIVREGAPTDAERLQLALVENVQREDLDPIERAKACRRLLEGFEMTQETVAERLGVERSTVANLVRLLELPSEIQEGVSRGTITAGHARALIRLNGNSVQSAIYERIHKESWSVRATEEACAKAAKGKLAPAHKPRPRQPAWVAGMQEQLTRALGSRVELRLLRRGGGRLVLHFDDLEELDRLGGKLGVTDELDELLTT